MQIVFFGLPLAALLLQADGHTVDLAVIAPFEAPGRRRLGSRTRILDAGVLGRRLDAQVDAALAELAPDLIVSWFWSRKLPVRWLERGRLGAIGVHPSLLPRHRGPNPFFWAIDQGDAETGVSVHRLTEHYDEGDVLETRALGIGDRDAWQLARALDRPSLAALRSVVAQIAQGRVPPGAPQDEGQATFAPEPQGDQLRVDFTWTTARVLRRIRALSPVPGVALELCSQELFLTRAEATSTYPAALEPGEAAAVGTPPTDVVIRTSDGAIRVLRAAGPEGETLPPAALAQLVASRTRAV
ncbi:MAG: hypothetical protein IT377_34060 [Polyangiaceae bacterium]|nr:hypothetical protein [Polyangiaceae bacterium]